ncbi:hypothetical protein M3Y99_00926800 [Aphelenchoides fujianensis]|nr:hypothetical protein M3Y99_00926800 [Aphelenchoides fujianensis]
MTASPSTGLYPQHTADFFVAVGDPPQLLNVEFSTVHSVTFLVDSRCGRPRPDCPRLCSIEVFDAAYCTSDCQFGESASYWTQTCEIIAAYWSYFNASRSQTLTNTREELRAERSLLFETRGQIAKDFLGVADRNQSHVLLLEQGVFVEGWQWDVFDAIYPAGFLGLAPGPKNFVVQAFAQRKIAAPILSFSPQARRTRMTFGGLSSNCTAWNHVRSLRDDRWVFRADRIEVYGMVYENELIQIVFDDTHTYVPRAIVDSLIADGILLVNEKVDNLIVLTHL